MASGFKRMQINTQERAVSTDINRLQKFQGKDLAEMMRYWMDVTHDTDDAEAGGAMAQPNTIETPLRGEIIDGLMVLPQNGSFDLFVSSGVAMLMSPDAAPDESNYKYINDTGVSTLGALVMTTGGGSPRLDVIECQIDTVEQTVTQSRDIFNASSGLFNATSVVKEAKSVLKYRVRLGSPGGGFPGVAAGWLPLAVALVPTGAASNDAMTFWDVRPLISDRAFAPHNMALDWPFVSRSFGSAGPAATVAVASMQGVFEGIFKGRRYGGRLRSNVPTVDTDEYLVADASNIDPVNPIVANAMVFAYFMFPDGLPRWARYKASGTRVPRGPKGIMVTSSMGPLVNGTPAAITGLPTALGFTASSNTMNGINAFSLYKAAAVLRAQHYNGRWCLLDNGLVVPVANTFSNTSVAATLAANVNFPGNARKIRISISISGTLPANVDASPNAFTFVDTTPNGNGFLGNPRQYLSASQRLTQTAGLFTTTFETFDIEPGTLYPSANLGTVPFVLNHGFATYFASAVVTSATVSVVGWELGP